MKENTMSAARFMRISELHDQLAQEYREMADAGTEHAGDIAADATRIAAGMEKNRWPTPTREDAEEAVGELHHKRYLMWCRWVAAHCMWMDFHMWPKWWADAVTTEAYRSDVSAASHAEYRFQPRFPKGAA